MSGCEYLIEPIHASRSDILTDGRPQQSLLHCIRTSKPDLILIDLDRVKLFSDMSRVAKDDVAEVRAPLHPTNH